MRIERQLFVNEKNDDDCDDKSFNDNYENNNDDKDFNDNYINNNDDDEAIFFDIFANKLFDSKA